MIILLKLVEQQEDFLYKWRLGLKKNVLLNEAFRTETREALLGFILAAFFVAGLGYTAWLWVAYNATLGLTDAIQAAFATCYALVIGGALIAFGGGHALERGKKAVYYHRKLALCPVTARGRR